MNTITKYILITILFLQFNNVGISQNKQLNDKYVIVLDIQEQNSKGIPDSISSIELIQAVNSVIEITNPEKVIYVKTLHLALSVSFKEIKVDTLPELELDSRLNIVNDNLFWKTKSDAFSNDKLVEFLSVHNAKEVIIVGLMAEYCLSSTAKGALKKGYDVYIIPEAIIGETEKSKTTAINKLVKKGIKIMPLNELLSSSTQ